MTEKTAFFRNTGKSLLPAEAKAEEMLRDVGGNQIVRVHITKPRRRKHHNWWFMMIQNYYENWPEFRDKPGDLFQPDNVDHLRAWALCRAGYRSVLGERLDQTEGDIITMMEFVEKCMARQRESGYGFVLIHNKSLVFVTPKSVAWDTLDETAFRPIADAVLDVLAAESGIPISAMMSEQAS